MAALAGVALGRFWEASHERKVWLRDAKFRAYDAIVAACNDLIQVVQDIVEASTSVESFKKAVGQWESAVETCRKATHPAQLVGSEAVWQKIVNFRDTNNNFVVPMLLNSKAWPPPHVAAATKDWEPRRSLWARTNELIDAMREDLGEKPVPQHDPEPLPSSDAT